MLDFVERTNFDGHVPHIEANLSKESSNKASESVSLSGMNLANLSGSIKQSLSRNDSRELIDLDEMSKLLKDEQ